MKLLLIGSTGLVGSQVLTLALRDERITSIVAPVRFPTHQSHPKLESPFINFEKLNPSEPYWKADAVICTLGTTMKTAGSRENFLRVDRDYPLQVAELAHKNGTPTFVLNSATGASTSSRFFYSRVKGEVEEKLSALNFKSLILVRPGLIGGNRKEFRLAEEIGKIITRTLHPILPKGLRINPAEKIAARMLDEAVGAKPGTRVIGADELIQLRA